MASSFSLPEIGTLLIAKAELLACKPGTSYLAPWTYSHIDGPPYVKRGEPVLWLGKAYNDANQTEMFGWKLLHLGRIVAVRAISTTSNTDEALFSGFHNIFLVWTRPQ